MTTLNELKTELARVDQLLHTTWLQERENARRRIAELAVEFQVSPATVLRDVESALHKAERAPAVLRAPNVDLPLRTQGTPRHIETKYRNAQTGQAWTGRGPRPRWLREALTAGAHLDDFLVQDAAGRNRGDPLREFQDVARRAHLAEKA